MWQVFYIRALEMAQERTNEAKRERLARDAHVTSANGGSRFDGLRRNGAIVAAGIARRLDECVAREQLAGRTYEKRAILPG